MLHCECSGGSSTDISPVPTPGFALQYQRAKRPIFTNTLPISPRAFWWLKPKPLRCSNVADAISYVFQVLTIGRRLHNEEPYKIKTQPQDLPHRSRRWRRRNGGRSGRQCAQPGGAPRSRKQRQTARQGISGHCARPQLLQHRKSLTRGGVTMMLTRKSAGAPAHLSSSRLSRSLSGMLAKTIDRRTFLKRSGVAAGAGAFASQLPFSMIGKAEAAAEKSGSIEVKRSVCTHCSVGCAIDAVVQNGVWVRQEPVFDSPLNLGAHCAKGASVREHGMTEHSHRLKYPMKLVNGKYQRISWDTAIDEIGGKMLAIRKESGPDALFFVGSSKHNNEQAYLMCKWVRLFGTNNTDHQARICHSTTVAGVANTWGYGAMTNSYNDEQNSKMILFLGSNAAEAHPVSMLHTLHAKEGGAKVIVVDPRFTRTAAKADMYFRIRSGSDIAFLHGMLYHIFKNGWEDKAYIKARVYGMDKVREESMKWTPDKVQDVTGMPEKEVYTCAEAMAKHRPSTIIWAMGQTQHTTGNALVRLSCILQLALGNVGVSGGGTNIYRGHDNVQGATDLGPNPDSLPAYYGIAPGSFAHWARVWNVDLKWLQDQFASPAMMAKPGITVSRWIDGVMEKNENIDQDSNLRGVFYWGHAPNSQSRGLDM